jgi:hypothetical protein
MRTINLVVIHQTDTVDATVEAIDRYHREVMHWKGIGYHQVIYRDGSVHRGRLDSVIGSHARGYNAHSIGICLVGKGPAFVGADTCPPSGWMPFGGYMFPPQWTALLAFCDIYRSAYGVSSARFVGHRELPHVAKTCPGFEVGILRAALAGHPVPADIRLL